MHTNHIASNIQSALTAIPDLKFEEAAHGLLAALGYSSERTLPNQSGDTNDFMALPQTEYPETESKQSFLAEAESSHFLFQFTSEEILENVPVSLFDRTETFNDSIQSFIFTAVTLQGETYPRSKYAEMTREINKRFRMPSAVMFRTASDKLSLGFAQRRRHRYDANRDVLGKVSLIREINPIHPHRAHIDILNELALPNRLQWMTNYVKPRNFDGLLDAWLDTLDTESLNRKFYGELFDWFERAVQEAKFPSSNSTNLKPEEHVIHLITRLLFVWFIKEKGLVSEDLFNEEQVAILLHNYDDQNGDSYYRAVLQNLFFATLNTAISKRGFVRQGITEHRDMSHYRYRSEMAEPDRLIAKFAKTPFINGGLFDCLDREASNDDGGYWIDCFTDNPSHRQGYSIPNRLFFDDKGLLTLFERFKFTVEENTPIEQEVALDPELLGKVFENLLASYNPETRETARKQTGSYYTPRKVVDYMVDEALVAALAPKANTKPCQLRHLLDYNHDIDASPLDFTDSQTDAVIGAIAHIKLLDPAVGSGAFLMGALHKMTLALRRLDPDNHRWENLQKDRATQRAAIAFDTDDQQERDTELREISETFERYRNSDFGRKLYLIQNSIFGVDLQIIACQIAKLRFFISLAIEQESNEVAAENYGIRPLPNLETRLIPANSLIGLDRTGQLSLGQTEIVVQLEQELNANRERHFNANNRQRKFNCRYEDRRLRQKLAYELKQSGDLSPTNAARVTQWDPYDQNTSADWFDPQYMFGVKDGFDIVIGNPPYIQLQKNQGELGQRYRNAGFETFVRTGDVYQLFIERGCRLLRQSSGLLAYITSNSWLKAEYGKSTRNFLARCHSLLKLLEMGKDVFESAIVDSSIILSREGTSGEQSPRLVDAIDIEKVTSPDGRDEVFPPAPEQWGQVRIDYGVPWSILSHTEQRIMDKILDVGTPLKEWDIEIYRGITTGLNQAFIIDNQTKDALVAEDPRSAEIIKPVLRGRDIRRYQAQWARLWLIDCHNGYGDVPAIDIHDYPAVKDHLDGYYTQLEKRYDKGRTLYNLRNCAYHGNFSRQKLFWADMAETGRFAFSDEEIYCNNKGYIMTGESLKYLCAILNSSLIAWWVMNTAATTGLGLTEWTIVTVERLPIPKVSPDRQALFIHTIDRILHRSNSKVDTAEMEAKLDTLVYTLYGLNDKEVASICP